MYKTYPAIDPLNDRRAKAIQQRAFDEGRDLRYPENAKARARVMELVAAWYPPTRGAMVAVALCPAPDMVIVQFRLWEELTRGDLYIAGMWDHALMEEDKLPKCELWWEKGREL